MPAQSIYAFATTSRTSAPSKVTPSTLSPTRSAAFPSGFLGLEHDHRSTVASVFRSSPVAGDEAWHLRDAWNNRLPQFLLRTLHVADRDLDEYCVHGVPPRVGRQGVRLGRWTSLDKPLAGAPLVFGEQHSRSSASASVRASSSAHRMRSRSSMVSATTPVWNASDFSRSDRVGSSTSPMSSRTSSSGIRTPARYRGYPASERRLTASGPCENLQCHRSRSRGRQQEPATGA